jgi:tripartite-type tricarboxylate transporter receptor subunit TctC
MLAAIGALIAAPAVLRQARAGEGWPLRSVRYVNCFPAGGATDTLSRVICQRTR